LDHQIAETALIPAVAAVAAIDDMATVVDVWYPDSIRVNRDPERG
jgi:hypothetical protein